MNLQLLEVGKQYKYKTLCEAFGIEPSRATDTRKKHMRTFEQYVKLEKEKTWYTVIEIYNEPKEREDGRKNNGDNAKIFKDDELKNAILSIIKEDLTNSILNHVRLDSYLFAYKLEDFAWSCGLVSSDYKDIIGEHGIVDDIYGKEAKKYVDSARRAMIKQITGTLTILKSEHLIINGSYGRIICYDFDVVDGQSVPLYRIPTTEELAIIDEKEQLTVDWFNVKYAEIKGFFTVEKYSDIFKYYGRRKDVKISDITDYCYKLCKEDIENYKSHKRRIYVICEKSMVEKVDLTHDTVYYANQVNEVYGNKMIENAITYADKKRAEQKKEIEDTRNRIEEESKVVKNFGNVKNIKYKKLCRELNCESIEELEQNLEMQLKNMIELKGITYCEKYIDKIKDEDKRLLMQTRLNYIHFENDTKLTNARLVSDLMALGAIARVSGYVESKKDYVLKEIELHKDCTIEVIKTENRQKHISLNTHTYDELANQLNLPDCDYLRVIVNYKYDTETGKGYVECSLAGEEDFTLKTVEVKTGMTIEEIVEKVNLDDIAFEELYDEYGNVITEKHIADVTLRGYSEVIVPYMTFRVSCIDEVKDFIRHIGYIRNLRGVSVDTSRSIAERKGEELC